MSRATAILEACPVKTQEYTIPDTDFTFEVRGKTAGDHDQLELLVVKSMDEESKELTGVDFYRAATISLCCFVTGTNERYFSQSEIPVIARWPDKISEPLYDLIKELSESTIKDKVKN